MLSSIGPQQVQSVSQPAVSPQPIPIFGQHVKPPVSKGNACKVSQQSDLLRIQYPSKSTWLVQEWRSILLQLGPASSVFLTLEQSDHPEAHAARLLDQFCSFNITSIFCSLAEFPQYSQQLELVNCSPVGSSTGRRFDCHFTQQEIRLHRW